MGPCRKREEVGHKLTGSSLVKLLKALSMLLLLTSRAYPAVNNVKRLTDTGSASRIQAADLAAGLVNRDKDLMATTDAHHQPVRVHAQRPGKGLQAKKSESLRAQDSAIQKPDQNRNNMSHSLYNHPYALNHIQLVK